MMRAFLFFCSPTHTHTGVLFQNALCFSTGLAYYSLEFSAALFVLVTLVIIISAEALMNDLFKVRYACTRRMCALPLLCALARFLFFFQKLMREGVTEFFSSFQKRKALLLLLLQCIYGWAAGASQKTHSTISHIEFVRAALKSSALPSFFCVPRCLPEHTGVALF